MKEPDLSGLAPAPGPGEIDWDDAYDNAGYIPRAHTYPSAWAMEAARYRETAAFGEYDISYGPHPRQKFDLFQPSSPSKGLVVFVHGGFWMKLDRSFWSHLAEGSRRQGWTVMIPSYVLAPEARISEITHQVGAAISKASAMHAGPLRLAGHSAGGHLVSRMVCSDSPLQGEDRERIERVLSISGVHDLRPLLRTQMNETLGLTQREARLESPALLDPANGSYFSAWVGADERPEFIRQTRLIVDAWSGKGIETRAVIEPGHHHFSVIEGLAHPDSAIVAELLR